MKRIVITGASGTLAQELIEQLQQKSDYELFPFSSGELDITKYDQVTKKLTDLKPDIIFHYAAKTDVDWCEKNVNESLQINVEATSHLAQTAKELSSYLVYPSTYYVYEGLETFPVDDRIHTPNLKLIKSVYSKHKFMAEQAIQQSSNLNSLILRYGSIFGGKNQDKKFVGKILNLIKMQSEIKAVTDRFMQPSYSKDTIVNTLAAVEAQLTGVYTMVGHGLASFYEYAEHILKSVGRTDVKLIPISVTEFQETAPRNNKLYAINGKLGDLKLDLMRDWRIALSEYLSEHVL